MSADFARVGLQEQTQGGLSMFYFSFEVEHFENFLVSKFCVLLVHGISNHV